ncbi:unnamed protein product [Rotaria sp. Silwood2]|nr:unnamed protein product [Rotaria sp. Silwood2]
MNSNSESFTRLWFDQNVNSTEDNFKTQKELSQVIHHLQIFYNNDECEQYIRQITKEKVVLIVSNSLGQHFVPQLHDLLQLSARYRLAALRFAQFTPIIGALQRIIFEIEMDPRLHTKAFADVTQLEIGEYEQARKWYRSILDYTPLVSENTALGLGKVRNLCKRADESLENLEEALHIRQRLLGQNHADIEVLYLDQKATLVRTRRL